MPQANDTDHNSLPDLYLISSYQLPIGIQTCSRVTQSKPKELKQQGKLFYLTNIEQVFYHLEDKSRFVYHASIPNRLNTRYIEDGHHDGASSFSFYEGLGAQTIAIIEEFDLSKSDDIKALIDRGLFGPAAGLMCNSNPENYANWCINNNQLALLEKFITDDNVLYDVINSVVYTKHAHVGVVLAKTLNIEPLVDLRLAFLFENAINKKQYELVNLLCKKLLDYLNDNNPIPPEQFNKIISILGINSDMKSGNAENFAALIKAKPLPLKVLSELLTTLCKAQQFDQVAQTYHVFTQHYQYHSNKDLPIWLNIIQWLAVYQQNELMEKILNSMTSHWDDNSKSCLVDLALATENTALKQHTNKWLNLNPPHSQELNLKDACKLGRFRQLQVLIAQGADIHKNSNAALHDCCELGFLGSVRLLLNNGADINAWMHRAIKLANKYHFIQLKQLLLDSGAEDKCF